MMEVWKKAPNLPRLYSGQCPLVPIRCNTQKAFYHRFMFQDAKIWEMTQAQRETWKNEILGNWNQYKHILQYDGSYRHRQQLRDMDDMGGGLILITEQYGTGKSTIANSHLKLWQVLKYKRTGELLTPHIFWRRAEARSKIRKTPNNTAHSIDEDMKATGTGSHNLEVHIQNIFETIRKTGKLVILVGVNLKPSVHGKAVAIQIEPFGFNRYYQANRFVVKDWNGKPLWMAVTQRCYLPHEEVYYEGELGTFSEYPVRSVEFSSTTTGVYSGTLADDEARWKDELVKHWRLNFPYSSPSIDLLEYWAIQIGIPPESSASIRRVCSAAKAELKTQKIVGRVKEPAIELSEVGWKGLRQMLYDLAVSKGASERDARAISQYYIPSVAKNTYRDIIEELELSDVLPATLGRAVRRTRDKIDTKELGDIGEKFVESHIDSLSPVIGSGSKGQADILITHNEKETALNVKLTLEEHMRRELPTTPECNWEQSQLVLLIPRLHEVRLYPITGQSTMINSTKGILCTPETLTDVLIGVLCATDSD